MKRGRRHHLLVYDYGAYRRLRWPALLLALAALAVWQFGPPVLWAPWGKELWIALVGDAAFPWLIVVLGCALIWIFTLIAPRTAYVQCRADGLRIGTPLWPITIPYARVNSVRTVAFGQVFPSARAPGRDRGWLKLLDGATAIAADFKTLPISPQTLRAFLTPYVFAPRECVACFLVSDWMGLSRELEHYRAQIMESAIDARRQDATDQMLARLRGQKR